MGGALSKEWKQDGKLYKYGDISVELQCIKLCRECGISVERADETDGGIAISNITSTKVMLEQADQSGRIDPDDFDEQTIIDLPAGATTPALEPPSVAVSAAAVSPAAASTVLCAL